MKKAITVILCTALLLTFLLTGCGDAGSTPTVPVTTATIPTTEASKDVAVDASGLKNITFNGEAIGTLDTEYTATLEPAEHHVLPEAVTVTVDGTALTSGFTYDPETGKLTVSAAAVTGPIAVSGEATESIVGTWEGVLDYSQLLNAVLGQLPDMGSYFNFSDIDVTVIMTFSDDGMYTLSIKDGSLEAAFEEIINQMKPGFTKYFEDYLAANNLDMTVDELFAANDTTLDEMIEQSFDPESLKYETAESHYEVKDGKLYLTETATGKINPNDANPYTLENGVLTIEVSELTGEYEILTHFFPLVLNRVS